MTAALPPPQQVPTRPHTRSASQNQHIKPPTPSSQSHAIPGPGPSSIKMGTSPISYGPMAGISFTNGGGFSFEGRPKSARWSSHANGGGAPGSYGARFYGDAMESPVHPFSTSITMAEPSSFATSSAAFHLPPTAFSSSYQRKSYAAAARGGGGGGGGGAGSNILSSSFASMSFHPMSFGNSYSKSHVHSLMAQHRTDAELTKSYECCGVVHEDLHQLLEHVEDVHPFSDAENIGMHMGLSLANIGTSGFSPITHAMDLDMEGVDATIRPLDEKDTTSGSGSTASLSPVPVPHYPLPPSTSKPSTPTEMASALTLSDVLKSPPDGEASLTASVALTASTASSPPEITTPATSAQPSPVFAAPKIAARNGFMGSTSTAPRPAAQQRHFDRAFNEVVAGSSPSASVFKPTLPPTAVAPNVLFGSTIPGFGAPTVPQNAAKAAGDASASQNTTENSTVPSANPLAEPPLPQPSLFSMHKPWRCPNPGCNKSYRQSNGLRYHQQKGQCDFAQHDAGDNGLSVEEAEERSRPFICAVGAGCKKRYRQMNGLKYHYLNSGEHGQYGLRMLQNGTHPQPTALPIAKRLTPSNTGSSTTPNAAIKSSTTVTPGTKSSATTLTPTPRVAPYAIPNRAAPPASPTPLRTAGAGVTNLGTFPTKSTNSTSNMNATPPTPAKDIPTTTGNLPSQRGKDAVLFAAVGSNPMRMEV